MAKLTKRAQKDLDALPQALASKAREIILRLDKQPALGKKLMDQPAGKRSARLGRSHRMIYQLVEGDVVLLTIAARKDRYR
jgi:mRNA-degrading endonuclease RelE of RelBE toxin-antitoxin system